jgi:hypothetical protein
MFEIAIPVRVASFLLSPRHCEKRSDEAIHCDHCRGYGLLRGACHRARVRATRWLALTNFFNRAPACPRPGSAQAGRLPTLLFFLEFWTTRPACAEAAIAWEKPLPKHAPIPPARHEPGATCRAGRTGSPTKATGCPRARKKTSACRGPLAAAPQAAPEASDPIPREGGISVRIVALTTRPQPERATPSRVTLVALVFSGMALFESPLDLSSRSRPDTAVPVKTPRPTVQERA